MNIYVSSLSPNITEAALKELFTSVGEVSSLKLITDRFSGASRGFAFVEMPNEEEGQAALDKLNNTEMEGKLISVKVARPKEENPGSFGPRNSGGYKKF
ncbi:MAG: RNA-binding protein [Chitinophagaceae bacterium]